MYEENQASLALMDAGSQRNSQPCTVLMYDEENECIYLNPGECDLSQISLDAPYVCTIEEECGKTSCVGTVRERFQGKNGNVILLQIENGFYKININ